MVFPRGFEPPTFRFASEYSVQLSYENMKSKYTMEKPTDQEKKARSFGAFCKKVDTACITVNVFLTVIAIGLGCLCLTMFITNTVVSNTHRVAVVISTP